MIMPKLAIKLKSLKEFLKKSPRMLAEHTFLSFLIFLLISLILGGLIFYKYSILAEVPEQLGEGEKFFQFDETTYQKILSTWQLRNEKFSEIASTTYPDPFQTPPSVK